MWAYTSMLRVVPITKSSLASREYVGLPWACWRGWRCLWHCCLRALGELAMTWGWQKHHSLEEWLRNTSPNSPQICSWICWTFQSALLLAKFKICTTRIHVLVHSIILCFQDAMWRSSWYIARLVVMYGFKKGTWYDEIGLCAQDMGTILSLIR